MNKLKDITLVCVEGTNNIDSLKNSIKAIAHSSKQLTFASKIFISPEIHDNNLTDQMINSDIIHYKISETLDWVGYNKFILKNLFTYIHTNFCLIIQSDGFVLNPHLWKDEFCDYDYIGATWHDWMIHGSKWVHNDVKTSGAYNLVGNGGFSLRSKKLLDQTMKAPFECDGPEDAYICQNHYNYFLDKDIKFAPVELANQFSRESNHSLSWDSVFGFHGERGFINNI